MRRLFPLLLLMALAAVPGRAEDAIDPAKLIGEWRHASEEQQQVAHYVFRPDFTFTAELQKDGETQRKFEGRWRIEDGMILYTYDRDSMGQIGGGSRERDRLLRIDESSYTIEGGDGGQRTYWRVKESK
jgi:hypothetical protein